MTSSTGKVEIIVVCGPTASGKTDAAMEMAGRLNGEIVSVDSVQVYRRMDIGTAKPDKALRDKVHHHMIDIVDPDEPFDAAEYAMMAKTAIHHIASRGKTPVLAGGAGLYFKALLEGFFEAPKTDPAIRAKWEKAAREKGNSFIHDWLKSRDPEAAAGIHPNNLKRVIRAIEVIEQTGEKVSDLRRLGEKEPPFIVRETVFLNPPREELYARINQRTDKMFKLGLLGEVEALLRDYGPEPASMKSIGYKECVDCLQGRVSREEAKELVRKNTRNYAKRQVTWFKNQKPVPKP
jgi:tRNA dimethylallyltransferase